jgi:TRAP-type transport system small permease protein
MNRFLNAYCRALEAVCALLMGSMVVLVFGNVGLRYFFSTGWLFSEEISRWMFVWMVFMGAVVVMRERGHMGTDMVIVRLPAWVQRVGQMAVQITMLYITWLICTGSWNQVLVNRDTQAPVSGLSFSIYYFAGVLFAVSTLLILLHQFWGTVTGRISHTERGTEHDPEDAKHTVMPHISDALADGRK